jgi:hypothetical protein
LLDNNTESLELTNLHEVNVETVINATAINKGVKLAAPTTKKLFFK